jgi:transcriptional regulator with XRE-family HTH domain
VSTVKTRRQQIADNLKDKKHRDAFVGSLIRVRLPTQIREMRLERSWNQSELGRRAGMKQSRICALEQIGYEEFSLSTLKRLASAFDVGLKVCFVPFSELVDDAAYPELHDLDVLSFDKDARLDDSVVGGKADDSGALKVLSSQSVRSEGVLGATEQFTTAADGAAAEITAARNA